MWLHDRCRTNLDPECLVGQRISAVERDCRSPTAGFSMEYKSTGRNDEFVVCHRQRRCSGAPEPRTRPKRSLDRTNPSMTQPLLALVTGGFWALAIRRPYVIETFNFWDFCTNWAPESEELMFTSNPPAPGAEPRPCTTMVAVAFDPNCPTVQCTDEVPPG